MKIKKFIPTLGLSAVFLFTSIFLWNCERDENFIEETSQVVEQSSRRTEIISLEKLPLKLIEPVNRLKKTIKQTSKSNEDLLIIDENQIIALIDSLSNTKYSIRFSLPDQPANILYNLILGTDVQNNETSPFVLKYTISNPEEVYENGFFDFSKMKGKISEYRLDTFLAYIDSITDRSTDVEPTPCDEYSNEGDTSSNDDSGNTTNNTGNTGGGGATGGSGGSGNTGSGSGSNNTNGDFDFPEFENIDGGCDITSYSIWSNGTTGEVIGITWNCADGSSGSWTNRTTDDEECPGGGDVPVNPKDATVEDLPPSCESFQYSRVGNNNWQTAAVTGIHETFLHINWDCLATHVGLFTQPLYFQLPINFDNPLNSGSTRTKSAILLHRAFESFDVWYNLNICDDTTTAADMQQRLLDYIKAEFEEEGGNVTLNPPNGYSGTPIPYESNFLGYGNCN